jgi:hypothetical protein
LPFYAGVYLENTILEPDSLNLLEKFIINVGDWKVKGLKVLLSVMLILTLVIAIFTVCSMRF